MKKTNSPKELAISGGYKSMREWAKANDTHYQSLQQAWGRRPRMSTMTRWAPTFKTDPVTLHNIFMKVHIDKLIQEMK